MFKEKNCRFYEKEDGFGEEKIIICNYSFCLVNDI